MPPTGASSSHSILWGWRVEGIVPDRYDLIGGSIALVGVGVIMYAPRG